MRKILLLFLSPLLVIDAITQAIGPRLQKAFQQFQNDSQLRHASFSLYVINTKTGQEVFDRNSGLGLAGASTQKIITAATAFDLLGKDFRYKTQLGYRGEIKNGMLDGNVFIIGEGDPTFGSWRWEETKDSAVLKRFSAGLKQSGILRINGSLMTNTSQFAYQAIPDGWIWQDIGNYYGAGAYPLNWKENQFDLILKSENKLGGRVDLIAGGNPAEYVNQLRAAGKESGDNAYLYLDNSLNGTIPLGENNFSISVAMHDPINQFLKDLHERLKKDSILIQPGKDGYPREGFKGDSAELKSIRPIYTNYSPGLDSIIYWFLRKSINLYGEALVKTIAFQKNGYGSTDGGIGIIKEFWNQRGVDADELNIYDGSGLSPLNRVTTHAQVEVLKYAKSRDWFPYFYDALPEYNGMKMKSGTIADVKGFCGYQSSKDGGDYIFSMLVNNYSGPTGSLVNKMFKVLDELK